MADILFRLWVGERGTVRDVSVSIISGENVSWRKQKPGPCCVFIEVFRAERNGNCYVSLT